jgi:predicted nucleotidyltransferase
VASDAVLAVAREVAQELAERGAEAVALVGSYVRGEAHAHSDIDLLALGPRRLPTSPRPDELLRRGGFLVSVSWRPADAHREDFRSPDWTALVPAWRSAIPIHDPGGVVQALKREAEAWTWADVEKPDEWVAAQITGYAEEVHKLLGALAHERSWSAAVQRSLLAVRLARIMAVRLRLLHETENELWDLVAAELGEQWRRAQAAALGTGGESLEASCRAALELYRLAAREADPLLNDVQREVVEHACAIAADHD